MKIFLTTMSMGIGGAETHIFELSLALLKQGHDITIISAGGDFLPRLIEKGVKHIYAPMNTRSISSMYASYKILCKAVNTEKPDIIHAHARIPALVSHYVAKKFNIPFVTTDHGKFGTSFLTRLMTRWGDKTLAVSEDLKRYLIDNYRIKDENIFLTINGINTDVFTPNKERNIGILDEFSIPHDAKIILSVSRIDTTAFMCAEELVECAEKIYDYDPKTRIVIVGNGNLYNDIKDKADKINAKLGINYIVLTGGRTDISEFCSVCDVFCGVSRAAMEAVASCKPALIAGDGAYFGILSDANLEEAESYNFTCRGIKGFDKNKFVEDIKLALSNDEYLRRNSAYLREYVISNLSAFRMANDAENVYLKAIQDKGKYDCVLLGYYGFGNMGDDALLMNIIKNLKSKLPYLHIAVLSYSVKSMREKLKSENVDVYNRFNPCSVLKVFKNSKNLMFGGGTLLQDNTSTKSLLYYLYMIRIAKHYGLDVILYANGIGPIRKAVNRSRITRILPDISLITARDKQTYEYIKELDKNANIFLTADEALTTVPSNTDCRLIEKSFENNRFICISVRKWRDINDEEYIKYAKVISDFCKTNSLKALFIVMEAHNDLMITQKLQKCFDVETQILHAGNDMNGDELVGVISKSLFTVSVRLHTLIFSACANVPMIGLSYDPKVSAFMKLADIDEEYIIDISTKCDEDLKKALDKMYLNIQTEKKHITDTMEKLRLSANKNAEITANFLNKNR